MPPPASAVASNAQCEQFNHADADHQHRKCHGIIVEPISLWVHDTPPGSRFISRAGRQTGSNVAWKGRAWLIGSVPRVPGLYLFLFTPELLRPSYAFGPAGLSCCLPHPRLCPAGMVRCGVSGTLEEVDCLGVRTVCAANGGAFGISLITATRLLIGVLARVPDEPCRNAPLHDMHEKCRSHEVPPLISSRITSSGSIKRHLLLK
jgi:hypothetical protein